MESNITYIRIANGYIQDDIIILLLEAGYITYSGQYNLRLFF
jgi:hypothetical protein